MPDKLYKYTKHLNIKEMAHKIHYIGNNQNSKFIIAKTNCGKHWQDIEEFTAIVSDVTCKKCNKLITQKQN